MEICYRQLRQCFKGNACSRLAMMMPTIAQEAEAEVPEFQPVWAV